MHLHLLPAFATPRFRDRSLLQGLNDLMPIVTTFRPLCWVGWVFGWGTKCSKSYNPGGTGEPVLFFVAGCPLQGGFRQLCVELGWTVVVISLCGFGLGLGALALPRMPQQGFTAIEIRASTAWRMLSSR